MPAFRGTPQEIADEIKLFPINLRRNLRAAEVANLKDAKNIAQAYSRGPYSLAQLADMGHPYAARHPHPPMTPGQINRQRGRFLQQFRVIGPKMWAEGGGLKSALLNLAPEWRFLKFGTRRMIARPLGELVLAKLRGIRIARLRDAVKRTIHP